jgi:hypothetical protein
LELQSYSKNVITVPTFFSKFRLCSQILPWNFQNFKSAFQSCFLQLMSFPKRYFASKSIKKWLSYHQKNPRLHLACKFMFQGLDQSENIPKIIQKKTRYNLILQMRHGKYYMARFTAPVNTPLSLTILPSHRNASIYYFCPNN